MVPGADRLCLHCRRNLRDYSRGWHVEPIVAEALDAGVRVVAEQARELVIGAVQDLVLSLPKDVPPCPMVLSVIDRDPLYLNVFLRVAMQDPTFGGRRKRE